MKELGRLITAMATPFNKKGEVDYKQARKLALALLDSGSDGVVVVGTTGESPTLVRSEEVRLFREIKDAVGKRGCVIAGTGSNSTAEALEATKQAEEAGVDACLLVVPYYNKPTQDGLYEHFKTIAESTRLRCILYNVPGRTVTNLNWETAVKLSKIKNIVGIKEANGNLEHTSRIIENARKGFLVWSGNDSDTLPMMSIGGYGVISVASHLVGKQIKDMIEHYLAGEIKAAAELHRHLTPIFSDLFIVGNPVPLKFALNHIGFNVGKPRLPLVEPDEKTAARILETLKLYEIDLLI